MSVCKTALVKRGRGQSLLPQYALSRRAYEGLCTSITRRDGQHRTGPENARASCSKRG